MCSAYYLGGLHPWGYTHDTQSTVGWAVEVVRLLADHLLVAHTLQASKQRRPQWISAMALSARSEVRTE